MVRVVLMSARPCTDFMDMLRRLISCRIIIIIIINGILEWSLFRPSQLFFFLARRVVTVECTKVARFVMLRLCYFVYHSIITKKTKLNKNKSVV